MSTELVKYNRLPKGYGIFPYVIIRLNPTIYIQVPIHLFGEIGQQSYKDYPGYHIYNLSETMISLPHRKKVESVNENLILLTMEMQELIQNQRNQTLRLCLVLDADWCFFLEKTDINKSDSIPEGGILLNEQFEIIAINYQHFNQKEEYHP